MSQVSLAGALGCSQSKINKIETKTTRIRKRDLERLVAVLDVPHEDAERLWTLHGLASLKEDDWPEPKLRRLHGAERSAVRIRGLHLEAIPGPLRCAPYVVRRAAELGPTNQEQLNALVAAREFRVEALTQNPGCRFDYLVSESALRRLAGHGRAATLEQLDSLPDLMAHHEHLTVRVLPYDAVAVVGTTEYTIAHMAEGDQDFVCVEDPYQPRYLTKPAQIAPFAELFDRLWAVALTRDDTVKFIERLRREEG